LLQKWYNCQERDWCVQHQPWPADITIQRRPPGMITLMISYFAKSISFYKYISSIFRTRTRTRTIRAKAVRMKEILDRRRRIEQERNLTSNSIELTEEIFSGNGSTQDQDIIGVWARQSEIVTAGLHRQYKGINISQGGRLDGKGQTILGVWFLPKHLDLKK
jgi:hypothetical protein